MDRRRRALVNRTKQRLRDQVKRAPLFRSASWWHVVRFELWLMPNSKRRKLALSIASTIASSHILTYSLIAGTWAGFRSFVWLLWSVLAPVPMVLAVLGHLRLHLLRKAGCRLVRSVDAQARAKNIHAPTGVAIVQCYHGAYTRHPAVDHYLVHGGEFTLHDELEHKERVRASLHKGANLELAKDVLRARYRASLNGTQVFRDEDNVCLINDPNPDDPKLSIFRGSYFLSLISHEPTRFDVVEGGGVRPTNYKSTAMSHLEQRLMGEDGVLASISERTGLAYHMGVNTLAITRDGYLRLWRQGASAQHSEGLIAPSGSGSLDWADREGASGLRGMVCTGMERELLEESTKQGTPLDATKIAKTLIVSYFRNIERGGLPGFTGITMLEARLNELTPNETETTDAGEWRLTWRAGTPEELGESLWALAKKEERMSVPMCACMNSVLELLNSDRKVLDNFFQR